MNFCKATMVFRKIKSYSKYYAIADDMRYRKQTQFYNLKTTYICTVAACSPVRLSEASSALTNIGLE